MMKSKNKKFQIKALFKSNLSLKTKSIFILTGIAFGSFFSGIFLKIGALELMGFVLSTLLVIIPEFKNQYKKYKKEQILFEIFNPIDFEEEQTISFDAFADLITPYPNKFQIYNLTSFKKVGEIKDKILKIWNAGKIPLICGNAAFGKTTLASLIVYELKKSKFMRKFFYSNTKQIVLSISNTKLFEDGIDHLNSYYKKSVLLIDDIHIDANLILSKINKINPKILFLSRWTKDQLIEELKIDAMRNVCKDIIEEIPGEELDSYKENVIIDLIEQYTKTLNYNFEQFKDNISAYQKGDLLLFLYALINSNSTGQVDKNGIYRSLVDKLKDELKRFNIRTIDAGNPGFQSVVNILLALSYEEFVEYTLIEGLKLYENTLQISKNKYGFSWHPIRARYTLEALTLDKNLEKMGDAIVNAYKQIVEVKSINFESKVIADKEILDILKNYIMLQEKFEVNSFTEINTYFSNLLKLNSNLSNDLFRRKINDLLTRSLEDLIIVAHIQALNNFINLLSKNYIDQNLVKNFVNSYQKLLISKLLDNPHYITSQLGISLWYLSKNELLDQYFNRFNLNALKYVSLIVKAEIDKNFLLENWFLERLDGFLSNHAEEYEIIYSFLKEISFAVDDKTLVELKNHYYMPLNIIQESLDLNKINNFFSLSFSLYSFKPLSENNNLIVNFNNIINNISFLHTIETSSIEEIQIFFRLSKGMGVTISEELFTAIINTISRNSNSLSSFLSNFRKLYVLFEKSLDLIPNEIKITWNSNLITYKLKNLIWILQNKDISDLFHYLYADYFNTEEFSQLLTRETDSDLIQKFMYFLYKLVRFRPIANHVFEKHKEFLKQRLEYEDLGEFFKAYDLKLNPPPPLPSPSPPAPLPPKHPTY